MTTTTGRETPARRGIHVPHTLVLLFAIMTLALVGTWLLPQGAFETDLTDAGRTVVVPGTYATAVERVMLPPWHLLTAVPRAMADAQIIISFLLIVGGTIAVLRATGTIDALLGAILRGVGYGVAMLKPYTVIVAQGLAELPPVSGLGYRLALFLPFAAIGIIYIWRYARRMQADPSRSLVAGVAEVEHEAGGDYPPLTGRRLLITRLTVAALGLMVYGIPVLGW